MCKHTHNLYDTQYLEDMTRVKYMMYNYVTSKRECYCYFYTSSIHFMQPTLALPLLCQALAPFVFLLP